MKNISELSLQEVCNYIACMNKLVEEKIVIFKPNKAFIKFNYDKATRHLEKQNIEQKEQIERLNNIINEFEKILKEEKTRTRYANDVERFTAYDYMLKRLQELKEVNK